MQINIQKESKKKTPHLAVCHETNPSANNRHTSLLMKSENVELTEEVIKALNKFGLENFPEDIQKVVTANNKRNLLESIIVEEFECKDDYGWNCVWLCDYDEQYAYFMRKCEMYRISYKQDGVNFTVGDVAEPVVVLSDYQVIDGELEISESAKEKLEEGVYAMLVKSMSDPEKAEKIKTLVSEFEKSLESTINTVVVGSDDINVNKSTDVENQLDIQEIMKSTEFQELLKAHLEEAQAPLKEELEKARAKAAEADEILKAAEQVAKNETVAFVKSANFIAEDKQDAMVAFLMKSRKTEDHELVMNVIKSAQELIKTAQDEVAVIKEQFALSEVGKDGKVTPQEINPQEFIKAKAEALFKNTK